MVLPELQTGEDEDWYVKLADLGPTQLVCMGHYCPLACMHAHKERQRILNTQPHTQKKTHVWCTGIFVAPISLRTMCSHTPQLPKEQQKVLGHCHRDRTGQDNTTPPSGMHGRIHARDAIRCMQLHHGILQLGAWSRLVSSCYLHCILRDPVRLYWVPFAGCTALVGMYKFTTTLFSLIPAAWSSSHVSMDVLWRRLQGDVERCRPWYLNI